MENTAKNFALQLGSLITLYISVSALTALLFGIINVLFPDAADNYWQYESATNAIRFSIAMLVVFFPAYLILTRMVNNIRRKESGMYLTLTKWLIYLSLLVGGAVLLGDLVAVIFAFLNGELVVKFALKAGAIFVVVGAAFVYYLLDARGHWQNNEKHSVYYGGIAALVVLASLIFGFMHIDPPQEVREARIDRNQVEDLTDMQWRVEEYARVNSMLPETIEAAYSDFGVPEASDERQSYEYNVTSDTTFELCAEFKTESERTESFRKPVMSDEFFIANPSNWDHGTGNWCFERTVNFPE